MRTALLALVACALLMVPHSASAGQWVQVSCANPDGSSAPSQGWTSAIGGGLVPPSSISTACNASTPMTAVIPQSTTAADNGYETFTYTPPAGSTLAGGSLAVSLSADGYGSLPQPASSIVAQVLSPADTGDDALESCGAWWYGCFASPNEPPGTAPSDYTGTITLPSDAGGTITVSLSCAAYSGAPTCDMGGSNGEWGAAYVSRADPLLSTSTTPVGADFTGTLLDANTSGTAQLDFNASETSGPGIYSVDVAIDGTSVYSGTPDTNNGECVSQGTYPSTSALEFDYAQPCPLQESISIPVNTVPIANGTHELTVTATDAAGESTTVLDQHITIANPVVATATSMPAATTKHATGRRLKALKITFTIVASFYGDKTHLSTFRVLKALPANATLTASDSGPRHPRIKPSREPAKRAGALWKEISKLTFTANDRLTITITAPGRTRQTILLIFHNGRAPTSPTTSKHKTTSKPKPTSTRKTTSAREAK